MTSLFLVLGKTVLILDSSAGQHYGMKRQKTSKIMVFATSLPLPRNKLLHFCDVQDSRSLCHEGNCARLLRPITSQQKLGVNLNKSLVSISVKLRENNNNPQSPIIVQMDAKQLHFYGIDSRNGRSSEPITFEVPNLRKLWDT